MRHYVWDCIQQLDEMRIADGTGKETEIQPALAWERDGNKLLGTGWNGIEKDILAYLFC